MLLDQPCHVIGAENGMTALELVDAGTADLVLVESQLPGLDALEVCRRVRSDMAHRLLPIVLISNSDDAASRVAALEAGADDVLPKPLERDELVARVRSMLRMKSARDRLEDVRQVIFALAKAAEAKDLFTLEHAERVADHSSELARQLAMTPDEVAEIRAGALIHDVGKLVVPDYILNKPGPLTESEFALVKKHPTVGAQIVLPLSGQRDLFAIVRSHHERYDGKGYPAGLAGEAIPLAARIVAVCDAYDAMTNQRSYRPAMPHQAAIERLVVGRGSQWDARVVDAFVALHRSGSQPYTEWKATVGGAMDNVDREMGQTISVLVADDNAEVLMATADLIRESAEVEIVSLVSNVEDAVLAASSHKPDLAFIDGWLRGGGAEAATPRIKAVSPKTHVVGLASAKDLDLDARLQAAGAAGCYEKEKLSAVLPPLLARVRRG